MAYADQLEKEGINSQYLVILNPRRTVPSGGWIVDGGSLAVFQSFDFGPVTKVVLEPESVSGVLTEAASIADIGTGGDWFYDNTTQRIYVDGGLSPNNYTTVLTYQIYLSTFDAYFNSDPLDSNSRVVYYEPLITQSSVIQESTTDDLFGFLPSLSSSVTISNATLFMTKHVYESSFNLAEVKVYHYLGELTTANTKLVFDGFSSNISYNDRQTRIEIFDNRAIFDSEFRHVTGKSFYGSSFVPNVDPDYEGRPIRKVYGIVDKLLPVNIDFNSNNPSTTNNRTWIVQNPHNNLPSVNIAVSSSPASSPTKTYIDSFTGLKVGDSVQIDKATDEYVTITELTSIGNFYIEHDALVSGAATSGDFVKRGFIGNVIIYRSGFDPLTLKYIQDYTTYTDATNQISGFTLVNNFEANYNDAGQMFEATGANSPHLLTSDLVYCRAYGPTNQETLGGSSFGGNSTTTGTLTQAVVVLYSILKNNVGLTESQIDTTQFTSLQSSVDDEIGFAIPSSPNSDFPLYKDVLTQIFQSQLLKFYINDSNEYSVTETDLLTTASKQIEDDEILEGKFNYTFDYKDIVSNIVVQYEPKDISSRFAVQQSYTSYSTLTNDTANYLHKVNKQKTFKSLHFKESDAQTLADRLSFALGDRRGILTFVSKNRFFDTEINQTLKVLRDRMPGFDYVNGTDREREGAVISTSKTLTSVTVQIDDQKGIEDNSADW